MRRVLIKRMRVTVDGVEYAPGEYASVSDVVRDALVQRQLGDDKAEVEALSAAPVEPQEGEGRRTKVAVSDAPVTNDNVE